MNYKLYGTLPRVSPNLLFHSQFASSVFSFYSSIFQVPDLQIIEADKASQLHPKAKGRFEFWGDAELFKRADLKVGEERREERRGGGGRRREREKRDTEEEKKRREGEVGEEEGRTERREEDTQLNEREAEIRK